MQTAVHSDSQIAPHGGRLINRLIQGAEKEQLLDKAKGLPSIQLTRRKLCDLEMSAVGAYSPHRRLHGTKGL